MSYKTIKSNTLKAAAFLLVWSLGIHTAFGLIKLPAIFQDGMVLQQSTKVAFWGTTDPSKPVRIETSWNQETYEVKADAEGNWKLKVKTPVAGGPYTVQLDDGDKRTLRDVLIGEVWICSGQSNMAMPVKGFSKQPILGSAELIKNAKNPNIKLFRIPTAQSLSPLQACNAAWESADAASVSLFSAVGYQFATMLQKKLNVPIGIIESAYGGTKVQAWMEQASVQKFPELQKELQAESDKRTSKGKVTKNTPTVLFNAMINPILGYTFRGALWYQGEGNRTQASHYAAWFAEMVHSWRKLWNQGEFPFYYVQIAPYKYDGQNESAFLREAQLKALSLIPNSGMAITLDIGSKQTIHPPQKTKVTERLVNLALSEVYGQSHIDTEGPLYKGMKTKRNIVTLSFKNTAEGLTSSGKELTNFEIAGADRVFHPAVAEISGKDWITVSSEEVQHPIAVRYAFKDWVLGDLYNTAGLPASSFRTDHWPQ